MFSRLIQKPLLMRWVPRTQAMSLTSSSGSNNAAAAAVSSERDLVNFPRRVRPIERPAVRLGFLPEEWFTNFHSKTGVSGPYAFLGTVGTFLVSKEFYVLEHDFYVGVALFLVFTGVVSKAGPDFTAMVNKGLADEENRAKAIRQDEIDRCTAAISEEDKAQLMSASYETLITAKRENVGLQLEAAYRERLNEAYQQVKLRLDYQLEKANVLRRTEQKHMVSWILNSVKSSITAKQEDEALKKCVADLKGLATAAK